MEGGMLVLCAVFLCYQRDLSRNLFETDRDDSRKGVNLPDLTG
jgi:hypothetical protein